MWFPVGVNFINYFKLKMSNALSRSTNVTTPTCHGPSVTHPEEAVTLMSFLVMLGVLRESLNLSGNSIFYKYILVFFFKK